MADFDSSKQFLAFDSEHRLRAENLAFDVDVWYPLLAKFTFRTVFLPLKRVEAEAICSFHDVSWRGRKKALTAADVECLLVLEGDIDEMIKNHFPNQPVMLRLCGRSPKDGDPFEAQGLQDQYDIHLRKLLLDEGTQLPLGEPIAYQDIDIALKVKAISKVSTLKVNNTQEAMSLLLTSERVYADMIDWLRFGEPEQIVLREWQDDLTMDNEFRLYVCKGRVTAISQYDHYGYYPHLIENKDFLQCGLLALWRSIHDELGDETMSYIVDIGYLPTRNTFVLIELSPFAPCTGASLFSWSLDKELLEGGKPMEFRLKRKEDVHPQLNELIQVNWEERWRKEVVPYTHWFHRDEHVASTQGWVTSLIGEVSNWMGLTAPLRPAPTESMEIPRHRLFVYGTLKRGFQWSTKYLSPRLGASFLGVAQTLVPYPLVVGACGVPYMLGDLQGEGKIVKGELWIVSDGALRGLDEYEGISKGYYCRTEIEVEQSGAMGVVKSAHVYMVQTSFGDLRDREYVDEYTLSNGKYLAIQHILVKQVAYYKTPSTWGRTQEVISTVAPTT